MIRRERRIRGISEEEGPIAGPRARLAGRPRGADADSAQRVRRAGEGVAQADSTPAGRRT